MWRFDSPSGLKWLLGGQILMSALPPIADIGTQSWDVCFVPKADKVHRSKVRPIRSLRRPGGLVSALSYRATCRRSRRSRRSIATNEAMVASRFSASRATVASALSRRRSLSDLFICISTMSNNGQSSPTDASLYQGGLWFLLFGNFCSHHVRTSCMFLPT